MAGSGSWRERRSWSSARAKSCPCSRASRGDARLWQWKGLLERALDEHSDALKSFEAAERLAPVDAGIAHGHARVALEAGIPAVALFERALRIAPNDPQIHLGLNAARLAAGEGEQAEADLGRMLARAPLWIDGHRQLAQMRSFLGRREEVYQPLEQAIDSHPREAALWQTLFDLQVQAEDYAQLRATIEKARPTLSPQALRTFEVVAASETGEQGRADAILADGAATIPPVWLIRHHLRNDRTAEASAIVDSELRGPKAADVWPYAETVWRTSGDPRLEGLTGHPRLVSVIDLRERIFAIPGLVDLLRSLHTRSGRYLNQSVRGGSQTDGPLFSRVEAEIRALRALIVSAVEEHVARFETLPDDHPQKLANAGKSIRFSGSWSVRLVDGGFHTSHVHPRGWISSALYLALPEERSGNEGSLALGEPPAELGLDLEATRMIEPKLGQLVLFPSWMWHGTRPFPSGERLTVAFDVAPPA